MLSTVLEEAAVPRTPPRPTVEPKDPPDPLWEPEEVADYFKVPLQTVYQWRSRGTGPKGIRVGRHTRYRRSDVEAWLTAQEAEG